MKKHLIVMAVVLIAFTSAFGQGADILKLKEKIIDIQNKGELGFYDFVLCSKILGFGSYVPLPEPVVDKNGTLLIYYEPVNVYTNRRDGLYEIWYMQDMALLKENGEILSQWDDILNFRYTAKKPVLDLFAQNSIDIKGQVPSGKYKFKAVLKDKLSGKTATKVIAFEIR